MQCLASKISKEADKCLLVEITLPWSDKELPLQPEAIDPLIDPLDPDLEQEAVLRR